jgi:hypothetical protein
MGIQLSSVKPDIKSHLQKCETVPVFSLNHVSFHKKGYDYVNMKRIYHYHFNKLLRMLFNVVNSDGQNLPQQKLLGSAFIHECKSVLKPKCLRTAAQLCILDHYPCQGTLVAVV